MLVISTVVRNFNYLILTLDRCSVVYLFGSQQGNIDLSRSDLKCSGLGSNIVIIRCYIALSIPDGNRFYHVVVDLIAGNVCLAALNYRTYDLSLNLAHRCNGIAGKWASVIYLIRTACSYDKRNRIYSERRLSRENRIVRKSYVVTRGVGYYNVAKGISILFPCGHFYVGSCTVKHEGQNMSGRFKYYLNLVLLCKGLICSYYRRIAVIVLGNLIESVKRLSVIILV